MYKYIGFLLLCLTLHATEVLDVRGMYEKSYTYESVGNYREAIKVLTPLYKKYPKGYTLNLRMAWLFYLEKKYKNAEEYYKKSMLIQPNAIEPKQGLLLVYLSMFAFEKAEQLGYEVLKIDYYSYYTNMYVIEALIGEKKYDEALALTKKMLVLYPTDIRYLELLAIIYKATKNDYLDTLYENILILDPNNTYVKQMMSAHQEKTTH